MNLNLGCGAFPMNGFTNVDIADIPGVDVVHDLDVAPWPFEDGSAKFILAWDIFEHVDAPLTFMNESWRVLAPGGAIELHVSFWKNENAYTDPTHKRFCTQHTFDYWVPGTELHDRYGAAYTRNRTCVFSMERNDLHGQELAVVLRKS